ncbi:hypothetical protein [Streptomyces sp. H34-S4]|uniref:hypothetical protein n=1 Tax=Streptomyces sp. H34-S4 TaxID=2996463 RepID=UPI002271B6EF|nr:hypothetical protein [Streptomyces sp. H34-S4]MCY0938457.1 hypothetical protein [Streptomyces sp. H34-S4]
MRATLDALTRVGWSAGETADYVSCMVNDAEDMHEWCDSTISTAPEFTDLAWYLHALVPALVTAGLRGYEAMEVRY